MHVLCSKVQARFAFATYLTRVQQRLMAENGHGEVDDIDTADEQMVSGLKQPLKAVPSKGCSI